eukprot:g3615.t1
MVSLELEDSVCISRKDPSQYCRLTKISFSETQVKVYFVTNHGPRPQRPSDLRMYPSEALRPPLIRPTLESEQREEALLPGTFQGHVSFPTAAFTIGLLYDFRFSESFHSVRAFRFPAIQSVTSTSVTNSPAPGDVMKHMTSFQEEAPAVALPLVFTWHATATSTSNTSVENLNQQGINNVHMLVDLFCPELDRWLIAQVIGEAVVDNSRIGGLPMGLIPSEHKTFRYESWEKHEVTLPRNSPRIAPYMQHTNGTISQQESERLRTLFEHASEASSKSGGQARNTTLSATSLSAELSACSVDTGGSLFSDTLEAGETGVADSFADAEGELRNQSLQNGLSKLRQLLSSSQNSTAANPNFISAPGAVHTVGLQDKSGAVVNSLLHETAVADAQVSCMSSMLNRIDLPYVHLYTGITFKAHIQSTTGHSSDKQQPAFVWDMVLTQLEQFKQSRQVPHSFWETLQKVAHKHGPNEIVPTSPQQGTYYSGLVKLCIDYTQRAGKIHPAETSSAGHIDVVRTNLWRLLLGLGTPRALLKLIRLLLLPLVGSDVLPPSVMDHALPSSEPENLVDTMASVGADFNLATEDHDHTLFQGEKGKQQEPSPGVSTTSTSKPSPKGGICAPIPFQLPLESLQVLSDLMDRWLLQQSLDRHRFLRIISTSHVTQISADYVRALPIGPRVPPISKAEADSIDPLHGESNSNTSFTSHHLQNAGPGQRLVVTVSLCRNFPTKLKTLRSCLDPSGFIYVLSERFGLVKLGSGLVSHQEGKVVKATSVPGKVYAQNVALCFHAGASLAFVPASSREEIKTTSNFEAVTEKKEDLAEEPNRRRRRRSQGKGILLMRSPLLPPNQLLRIDPDTMLISSPAILHLHQTSDMETRKEADFRFVWHFSEHHEKILNQLLPFQRQLLQQGFLIDAQSKDKNWRAAVVTSFRFVGGQPEVQLRYDGLQTGYREWVRATVPGGSEHPLRLRPFLSHVELEKRPDPGSGGELLDLDFHMKAQLMLMSDPTAKDLQDVMSVEARRHFVSSVLTSNWKFHEGTVHNVVDTTSGNVLKSASPSTTTSAPLAWQQFPLLPDSSDRTILLTPRSIFLQDRSTESLTELLLVHDQENEYQQHHYPVLPIFWRSGVAENVSRRKSLSLSYENMHGPGLWVLESSQGHKSTAVDMDVEGECPNEDPRGVERSDVSLAYYQCQGPTLRANHPSTTRTHSEAWLSDTFVLLATPQPLPRPPSKASLDQRVSLPGGLTRPRVCDRCHISLARSSGFAAGLCKEATFLCRFCHLMGGGFTDEHTHIVVSKPTSDFHNFKEQNVVREASSQEGAKRYLENSPLRLKLAALDPRDQVLVAVTPEGATHFYQLPADPRERAELLPCHLLNMASVPETEAMAFFSLSSNGANHERDRGQVLEARLVTLYGNGSLHIWQPLPKLRPMSSSRSSVDPDLGEQVETADSWQAKTFSLISVMLHSLVFLEGGTELYRSIGQLSQIAGLVHVLCKKEVYQVPQSKGASLATVVEALLVALKAALNRLTHLSAGPGTAGALQVPARPTALERPLTYMRNILEAFGHVPSLTSISCSGAVAHTAQVDQASANVLREMGARYPVLSAMARQALVGAFEFLYPSLAERLSLLKVLTTSVSSSATSPNLYPKACSDSSASTQDNSSMRQSDAVCSRTDGTEKTLQQTPPRTSTGGPPRKRRKKKKFGRLNSSEGGHSSHGESLGLTSSGDKRSVSPIARNKIPRRGLPVVDGMSDFFAVAESSQAEEHLRCLLASRYLSFSLGLVPSGCLTIDPAEVMHPAIMQAIREQEQKQDDSLPPALVPVCQNSTQGVEKPSLLHGSIAPTENDKVKSENFPLKTSDKLRSSDARHEQIVECIGALLKCLRNAVVSEDEAKSLSSFHLHSFSRVHSSLSSVARGSSFSSCVYSVGVTDKFSTGPRLAAYYLLALMSQLRIVGKATAKSEDILGHAESISKQIVGQTFLQGQQVAALWWQRNPAEELPLVYKATIVKVNGDGTYHLNYADGDVDKAAPEAAIRGVLQDVDARSELNPHQGGMQAEGKSQTWTQTRKGEFDVTSDSALLLYIAAAVVDMASHALYTVTPTSNQSARRPRPFLSRPALSLLFSSALMSMLQVEERKLEQASLTWMLSVVLGLSAAVSAVQSNLLRLRRTSLASVSRVSAAGYVELVEGSHEDEHSHLPYKDKGDDARDLFLEEEGLRRTPWDSGFSHDLVVLSLLLERLLRYLYTETASSLQDETARALLPRLLQRQHQRRRSISIFSTFPPRVLTPMSTARKEVASSSCRRNFLQEFTRCEVTALQGLKLSAPPAHRLSAFLTHCLNECGGGAAQHNLSPFYPVEKAVAAAVMAVHTGSPALLDLSLELAQSIQLRLLIQSSLERNVRCMLQRTCPSWWKAFVWQIFNQIRHPIIEKLHAVCSDPDRALSDETVEQPSSSKKDGKDQERKSAADPLESQESHKSLKRKVRLGTSSSVTDSDQNQKSELTGLLQSLRAHALFLLRGFVDDGDEAEESGTRKRRQRRSSSLGLRRHSSTSNASRSSSNSSNDGSAGGRTSSPVPYPPPVLQTDSIESIDAVQRMQRLRLASKKRRRRIGSPSTNSEEADEEEDEEVEITAAVMQHMEAGVEIEDWVWDFLRQFQKPPDPMVLSGAISEHQARHAGRLTVLQCLSELVEEGPATTEHVLHVLLPLVWRHLSHQPVCDLLRPSKLAGLQPSFDIAQEEEVYQHLLEVLVQILNETQVGLESKAKEVLTQANFKEDDEDEEMQSYGELRQAREEQKAVDSFVKTTEARLRLMLQLLVPDLSMPSDAVRVLRAQVPQALLRFSSSTLLASAFPHLVHLVWPAFLGLVVSCLELAKPGKASVSQTASQMQLQALLEPLNQDLYVQVSRGLITIAAAGGHGQTLGPNISICNKTTLASLYVSGPVGSMLTTLNCADTKLVHPLPEGFILDVRDTIQHKWIIGAVLAVKVDQVLVTYHGWDPKWNEWISIHAGRLAPFLTHCSLEEAEGRPRSAAFALDLSDAIALYKARKANGSESMDCGEQKHHKQPAAMSAKLETTAKELNTAVSRVCELLRVLTKSSICPAPTIQYLLLLLTDTSFRFPAALKAQVAALVASHIPKHDPSTFTAAFSYPPTATPPSAATTTTTTATTTAATTATTATLPASTITSMITGTATTATPAVTSVITTDRKNNHPHFPSLSDAAVMTSSDSSSVSDDFITCSIASATPTMLTSISFASSNASSVLFMPKLQPMSWACRAFCTSQQVCMTLLSVVGSFILSASPMYKLSLLAKYDFLSTQSKAHIGDNTKSSISPGVDKEAWVQQTWNAADDEALAFTAARSSLVCSLRRLLSTAIVSAWTLPLAEALEESLNRYSSKLQHPVTVTNKDDSTLREEFQKDQGDLCFLLGALDVLGAFPPPLKVGSFVCVNMAPYAAHRGKILAVIPASVAHLSGTQHDISALEMAADAAPSAVCGTLDDHGNEDNWYRVQVSRLLNGPTEEVVVPRKLLVAMHPVYPPLPYDVVQAKVDKADQSQTVKDEPWNSSLASSTSPSNTWFIKVWTALLRCLSRGQLEPEPAPKSNIAQKGKSTLTTALDNAMVSCVSDYLQRMPKLASIYPSLLPALLRRLPGLPLNVETTVGHAGRSFLSRSDLGLSVAFDACRRVLASHDRNLEYLLASGLLHFPKEFKGLLPVTKLKLVQNSGGTGSKGTGKISSQGRQGDDDGEEEDEDEDEEIIPRPLILDYVDRIMEVGFDKPLAQAALIHSRGNLDAAVMWCMEHGAPGISDLSSHWERFLEQQKSLKNVRKYERQQSRLARRAQSGSLGVDRSKGKESEDWAHVGAWAASIDNDGPNHTLARICRASDSSSVFKYQVPHELLIGCSVLLSSGMQNALAYHVPTIVLPLKSSPSDGQAFPIASPHLAKETRSSLDALTMELWGTIIALGSYDRKSKSLSQTASTPNSKSDLPPAVDSVSSFFKKKKKKKSAKMAGDADEYPTTVLVKVSPLGDVIQPSLLVWVPLSELTVVPPPAAIRASFFSKLNANSSSSQVLVDSVREGHDVPSGDSVSRSMSTSPDNAMQALQSVDHVLLAGLSIRIRRLVLLLGLGAELDAGGGSVRFATPPLRLPPDAFEPLLDCLPALSMSGWGGIHSADLIQFNGRVSESDFSLRANLTDRLVHLMGSFSISSQIKSSASSSSSKPGVSKSLRSALVYNVVQGVCRKVMQAFSPQKHKQEETCVLPWLGQVEPRSMKISCFSPSASPSLSPSCSSSSSPSSVSSSCFSSLSSPVDPVTSTATSSLSGSSSFSSLLLCLRAEAWRSPANKRRVLWLFADAERTRLLGTFTWPHLSPPIAVTNPAYISDSSAFPSTEDQRTSHDGKARPPSIESLFSVTLSSLGALHQLVVLVDLLIALRLDPLRASAARCDDSSLFSELKLSGDSSSEASYRPKVQGRAEEKEDSAAWAASALSMAHGSPSEPRLLASRCLSRILFFWSGLSEVKDSLSSDKGPSISTEYVATSWRRKWATPWRRCVERVTAAIQLEARLEGAAEQALTSNGSEPPSQQIGSLHTSLYFQGLMEFLVALRLFQSTRAFITNETHNVVSTAKGSMQQESDTPKLHAMSEDDEPTSESAHMQRDWSLVSRLVDLLKLGVQREQQHHMRLHRGPSAMDISSEDRDAEPSKVESEENLLPLLDISLHSPLSCCSGSFITLSSPKSPELVGSGGGEDVSGDINIITPHIALLEQIDQQLKGLAARDLRGKAGEWSWKAIFAGSLSAPAEGFAGPFRESLSALSTALDLEARSSRGTEPIFILSPNGRHQVGLDQDKLVLNPRVSVQGLQRCFSLGQLMGCAVRSTTCLALNLAPAFWQLLLYGSEVLLRSGPIATLTLLEGFAFPTARLLQFSSRYGFPYDSKQFSDLMLHFTTSLSEESQQELFPGGCQVRVPFAEQSRLRCMATRACMQEAYLQLAVIRAGLDSVLPGFSINSGTTCTLSSLLTWQELEMRVCGRPGLDLDLLRKHTKYSGCTADSAAVKYFWQVLHDFSEADRARFLQFAWAKSRLPHDMGRECMTLSVRSSPSALTDQTLPKAETCFFLVELPNYSSLEIMRNQLSIAILCVSMSDAR